MRRAEMAPVRQTRTQRTRAPVMTANCGARVGGAAPAKSWKSMAAHWLERVVPTPVRKVEQVDLDASLEAEKMR